MWIRRVSLSDRVEIAWVAETICLCLFTEERMKPNKETERERKKKDRERERNQGRRGGDEQIKKEKEDKTRQIRTAAVYL